MRGCIVYISLLGIFLSLISQATSAASITGMSSDSSATMESDSARNPARHLFSLDEVVVTAIRSPLKHADSPSRVLQISGEEIRTSPEKNLGELLTGKSGALVRRYGAAGSLQTLSFRGMSAEHSAILIDGIPVNNFQTGLSDLSLISMDDIDRVEIVRGGSSSHFGSDAMGGVVNILTRSSLRTPRIQVGANSNSAGSQGFGVKGYVPLSNELGIQLGTRLEYGRGDFPFMISGASVVARRGDSDFRTRSFFLKGDWEPTEVTKASFTFSGRNTERGTPGPVLTVANQGTARQLDEMLFTSASVSSRLDDDVQLTITGGFQNSYEQYVDRAGIFPADNYYRNTLATLQSSADFSLSNSVAFHPGIEFGSATASGNALAADHSRQREAIFLGSEFHFDAAPWRFSFYPSGRFDNYSIGENAFSPKLGINLRFSGDPVLSGTLHGTVGNNFRVPTFNELYYSGSGGLGNMNLLPERSFSFDAGVTFTYYFLGAQEFDVTYYSIDTENRIQWLPGAVSTIWSPVNIGKTKSSGGELDFRWRLPGEYISLEGNYSTIDARKSSGAFVNDPALNKQLIYVPLETGYAAIAATIPVSGSFLSKIIFRIEDVFVGQRYTAEDNSQALPSYQTINASAAAECSISTVSIILKGEVGNLLDKSYEIIPRYPMPIRNQSFSVVVQKIF